MVSPPPQYGYAPPYRLQQDPTLADPWERFLARMIDSVIVSGLALPLWIPVFIWSSGNRST